MNIISKEQANAQLETQDPLPKNPFAYNAKELESFPHMCNDDSYRSFSNNPISTSGNHVNKESEMKNALPGSHWCQ